MVEHNYCSSLYHADCDYAGTQSPINFFPDPPTPTLWWDVESFRSRHPGGAQLCFADGSYSVKTGSDDGLPPGEYVVTVVSMTPPPEGVSREMGELLTPQRYGQRHSSDLKFAVESGKNVIDLELHSET